jgi:hypothetical protein
VKLLVDAMLPETVETEAPPGVAMTRWSGGEASDEDLLRAGAHSSVRAVVFFDRRSLSQPFVRSFWFGPRSAACVGDHIGKA